MFNPVTFCVCPKLGQYDFFQSLLFVLRLVMRLRGGLKFSTVTFFFQSDYMIVINHLYNGLWKFFKKFEHVVFASSRNSTVILIHCLHLSVINQGIDWLHNIVSNPFIYLWLIDKYFLFTSNNLFLARKLKSVKIKLTGEHLLKLSHFIFWSSWGVV